MLSAYLAATLTVSAQLGTTIDSVASAAAAQGFHGVILAAEAGKPVLVKGYGIANHARQSPFAASTVVQIGSNVKDFTKAAILQLVEAGRLSLSDSLGKFFARAPADKRALTIGHLLEHTAGFPMGVGPDNEALALETFLERLFARPLEFTPGTARQYSNAGYSVLAAIIQHITGRAFDAHLDSAIFRPLGMRETGLLRPRFPAERVAHGYRGGEDRGTMLDMPHTPDGHYWNLRGNGGLISTVSDMHRFYRALRDTTLLKDPRHRAMVLPPDQPQMLAGSDGVSFFLYGSYPRERLELIVATNHAEYQAPRLSRQLLAALGIEVGSGREVTTVQGAGGRALRSEGAEGTAQAYIAAFNTGDTAVMRRFFETRGTTDSLAPPVATRVARYRETYAELGTITIVSVRQTTQALEVVVRTARGEQATLGFITEPVTPFRLRGLRLEVGGP